MAIFEIIGITATILAFVWCVEKAIDYNDKAKEKRSKFFCKVITLSMELESQREYAQYMDNRIIQLERHPSNIPEAKKELES